MNLHGKRSFQSKATTGIAVGLFRCRNLRSLQGLFHVGLSEGGSLPAIRCQSVRPCSRLLPVGRMAGRHCRRALCLRSGQGGVGPLLGLAVAAASVYGVLTCSRSRADGHDLRQKHWCFECAVRGTRPEQRAAWKSHRPSGNVAGTDCFSLGALRNNVFHLLAVASVRFWPGQRFILHR